MTRLFIMVLVGIIVMLIGAIITLSFIILSKNKNKSIYDQVKEDEEQMDYLKNR